MPDKKATMPTKIKTRTSWLVKSRNYPNRAPIDATTNFYIDYLPKGVYVFEYDLRANNAGTISNGITQLQNMYAPEFSTHLEGAKIEIE